VPAVNVDTLAAVLVRAASVNRPGQSRVFDALDGEATVDADLRRPEVELETSLFEQLLEVGPDRSMSLH
jgi:hypothetical protein